eukprot:CAMPEP_0198264616 /NCGR_PEP_ID=MMETSP1447-20131203/16262_1 /TAXON_ID=420782 /ORGANISM="Chaetoceros dichaeta, Strain CCMP1751" /LENGTH=123 /DNA_ID=CAMNT_0043953615 /DNA_START=97 /DNA_END=468 /DNA_ORIENTATION=+
MHRSGVINIATISAGFEKSDFLVREEKGHRVFFDFFEEAFNYIANKGYSRMPDEEESEWIQLMKKAHLSIKGGTRYNSGTLLIVLSRPVDLSQINENRNKKVVEACIEGNSITAENESDHKLV